MVSLPKVNLLLSTYNGERYLGALLDSISAQTYPAITLTVRDDGSTDSTLGLLKAYAEKHDAVQVIPGEHAGVADSFGELLRLADREAEFTGFADQDDIWDRLKVAHAVEILRKRGKNEPLLYCSRVEYVDAKLGHLGFARVPSEIGFHNALVENIAAGCTIVINRAAMELLGRRIPRGRRVHDHWLYLVISAFGQVIYDSTPLIQYRQHERNVIGGSAHAIDVMRFRLLRFMKWRVAYLGYFDQAAEFRRIYGSLLKIREKELLEGFLASKDSLAARIRYALLMRVRRQTALDDLLLRLTIVLGAY